MVDLVNVIDPLKSEILNVGSKFNQVYNRKIVMKSEADAEILIHIEFKNSVSLSEVCVYGTTQQNKPSQLKVFCGFQSFDQVKNMKPTVQGKCEFKNDCYRLQVPMNLLQTVGQITLYMPTNQSNTDETEFSGFQVYGKSIESANSAGHTFAKP